MKESAYWLECITNSFAEQEIEATPEQIKIVAMDVAWAHQMYGEANGHHNITNPVEEENRKLRAALKKEQSKVVCPECKGNGSIKTYGGTFESVSQCDRCRGEGKAQP